MNKKGLIVIIVILALILLAGLGFIAYKTLGGGQPVEPSSESLPQESQQAPVEDVALPAEEETPETTEEPTEVPTTAPEIVLDEDDNEWGELIPSDTQPVIPEPPTQSTEEQTQPTEAPTTTAPTVDDSVGELPGLGENDTPWN